MRNRRWPPRSAPKTCSGSAVLSRVRAHVQDLRQSRLKAEEAQGRLQHAARQFPDSLSGLLLGARLLDYAGISFWLGREAGDRNHSGVDDLMDLITELRDIYRGQWQANTLRTASARRWADSMPSTNTGGGFKPDCGIHGGPFGKGNRCRRSIRCTIETAARATLVKSCRSV
jgi:hypothetical protein